MLLLVPVLCHLVTACFIDKLNFKFQKFTTSKIFSELESYREENNKGNHGKSIIAVVLVRKNNEFNIESNEEDDSDTNDYNNGNDLKNTNFSRYEENTKTGSLKGRILDYRSVQSKKDYQGAKNLNLLMPSAVILRSSCYKEKCEKKCVRACRLVYESQCDKFSCSSEVKRAFKRKCKEYCNDEFDDYGAGWLRL